MDIEATTKHSEKIELKFFHLLKRGGLKVLCIKNAHQYYETRLKKKKICKSHFYRVINAAQFAYDNHIEFTSEIAPSIRAIVTIPKAKRKALWKKCVEKYGDSPPVSDVNTEIENDQAESHGESMQIVMKILAKLSKEQPCNWPVFLKQAEERKSHLDQDCSGINRLNSKQIDALISKINEQMESQHSSHQN